MGKGPSNSASNREGNRRRCRMSAAKAGQATRRRVEVSEALKAPDAPGISFGGWTLRWAGDCWSVGRWKAGETRPRWRDATWHARIEHGLSKLLSRNLEGDASELRELAERVDLAYCGIVRELQAVRGRDQS